jgi:hypothetical protein
MSMIGRTYLERGQPVVVLKRWAVTHPPDPDPVIWIRPPRRNAPRNVLIGGAAGAALPAIGARRRPWTRRLSSDPTSGRRSTDEPLQCVRYWQLSRPSHD